MNKRILVERQLRALAGRKRLEIISYLKKNKSSSSANIAKRIGLSRQATSQHLSILASANIVTFKKRGLFVTYRLFVPQSSIVRKVLQEL
ncbi:MAG: metalloregulator ArsR/SmtB family transcription factor [Candidatus Peribacteraceae bacterium]|jgi:DNA-binding transcriptional ArsR family regulator|nr:metalloregulator ArsR/SmtB family transcription factor [Candidatus Peribacteraceae bacterium]HCI04133.1 ArsR family transcriptional regulator [Candidatus Peribacteria bacterium]|tara:strand:- start:1907 stop:2176 length:270 start_codon:yes stop_codon:yes gene_type:complete